MWLPALALAFVFTACRKEADEKNPVVDILSPSDYATFQPGDSIFIEATVSDETRLVSVMITLTDKDYIVKDHMVNIPVTGNPQHFWVWYDIRNTGLPDGDYYLQVRAFDGVNTKFKYKPIRIVSLPLILRGIIAVGRQSGHQYTVYTTDTLTGEFTPFAQNPHFFSASDVSHQTSQLFLVGRGFGECHVMDLEDFTLDFILPESGTPSLYYHEQVLAAGDRFYLGLTEGFVKGYNRYGVQHFIATMEVGRKPCRLALHRQQYLLVAEEQRSGTGSAIASYFLSSGTKWAEYKLPDHCTVVAMHTLNADEVLLTGNVLDQAVIYLWNHTVNVISTPVALPAGKVRDVAAIGQGRFILAHDNGLFLYESVTHTLVPWKTPFDAHQLAWYPAGGILYCASGKQMSALAYGSGNMVWQETLPDTVAAFHLHFTYR